MNPRERTRTFRQLLYGGERDQQLLLDVLRLAITTEPNEDNVTSLIKFRDARLNGRRIGVATARVVHVTSEEDGDAS
jgi:hypothetical protein